jgi:hypothetical protein
MKMHVYRPDGAEPEITERPFARYAALKKELQETLHCNWPEHVSVLFEGKPADMFVDENGHAKNLPRNEAATAIYRAYSLRQHPNTDPESLPFIAGTAVLFDAPVWS